MVLAHNLNSAMKNLVLEGSWVTRRMETIRCSLINSEPPPIGYLSGPLVSDDLKLKGIARAPRSCPVPKEIASRRL
jgi:hypothetical protein